MPTTEGEAAEVRQVRSGATGNSREGGGGGGEPRIRETSRRKRVKESDLPKDYEGMLQRRMGLQRRRKARLQRENIGWKV